MNPYDYIAKLKKINFIPRDYLPFLENIYLYVDNLKPYKVSFQFDPNTQKKAKKIGIDGEWEIKTLNGEKLLLMDDDGEIIEKTSKIMLKYNCFKKEIDIFTGED